MDLVRPLAPRPRRLTVEPKISASPWKVSIREPNGACGSLRVEGARMEQEARAGGRGRRQGRTASPARPSLAWLAERDEEAKRQRSIVSGRRKTTLGRRTCARGGRDGTETRRNPLKSPDSGAEPPQSLTLQKGTERSASHFSRSRRTLVDKESSHYSAGCGAGCAVGFSGAFLPAHRSSRLCITT